MIICNGYVMFRIPKGDGIEDIILYDDIQYNYKVELQRW